MSWDQHIKILQFAGALLAIPVALGGTYSAYRTFLATEPVCDSLKNSIVSTLERKVAADAKRALVQKDLGEFERTCAETDPAALKAFIPPSRGWKP
jgi:hypothetical protein